MEKGKRQISSAETMRVFDELPEEAKKQLEQFLVDAKSMQEFISKTLVGSCPKCGSSKTRDCEDTPIDDICVGICLECFTLWCLECGAVFEEGQTGCGHWGICDECKFQEVDADDIITCPYSAREDECPTLKEQLGHALRVVE